METSSFVKQLASNNRVVRDNALEKLQKYLSTNQFKSAKQLQFDKLWKGLYFAMWFSDRPRPQQRLASQLGSLYGIYFDPKDNKVQKNKKTDDVELTLNDEAFIKFSKSFWKVLCLEWMNIDRFRLDKYLLLTRRVLYNQLIYLQQRTWNEKLVNEYITRVLKSLPLSGDRKVYTGIPMHIVDILLDEWERLMRQDEIPLEEVADDDEEKEYDYVTLVKDTPLSKFIDIFHEIRSDYIKSKVLRDQIKENLLEDERLAQWGIVEAKSVEDTEADESEEVFDDEEWKGF